MASSADHLIPPPLSKAIPGKFEEIGAEIGRLVDKKQKAYGRSFETCPKALALLCPNGIRVEQYEDALAFARSWDKWSRIFTNPTAFGEDPRQDLAGYALLMNGKLLEKTETNP